VEHCAPSVNSSTHYPISWGNKNLGVNSEDGIEA
jgi:hypothetical protein